MIYHHNYENMNLQQILETFSHHQQVNFALYCSNDVQHLSNNQRVIDCNLIVERWLKGEKVDLITAAYSDATAAYATISSAVYADSAAYYAVSAAVSSASASAADNSAYYAASAKSYHLYPNNQKQRIVARVQFYKEYNQIAQNWLSYWTITNFPKDEPDFPIFDFLIDMNLISYLLPKKENYYYLNLNGFDIKHVNEAELLKEANTIHIKNILRRIINNAETS